MAFRLSVRVPNVEYRGYQQGYSERSKRNWLTLIWEDQEFNQLQTSVPAEMQNDVREMSLRKGERCEIAILAVATADGNSYVQLRALPEVYDEDDPTGGAGF